MGGVAGTRGWTDGASVVSMNNGVNGRSIVCIFGSPDIHLLDRFHPGSIVIVRGYFQRSGDSMLLVCSKLEIR